MIHITLEDLYHGRLVFWWILVKVFYERKEVGVAFICDISSFDKLEDVVVALELFLSSVHSSLGTTSVLCVRFVVHSGIGHVGGRVFLLECHLETEAIGLDEFEFLGFESREEALESFREVMARIFVDGCSIEIDEEVLESELLHAVYGDIRILMREVFSKLRHETIVVVTRTIVVDEIREKGSDSVDPGGIFLFP